jgi:hypothetical protein
MGQGAYMGAMTAAIASMAFAPPVRALEMAEFLGRWGGERTGYDCKSGPGDETMPVNIERDADGKYTVGAYVFHCSADSWVQRGAFIGADVTCGHEGDEEITRERIELAKTNYGQLVLVYGTSVEVLDACKAAE